MGLCWPRASSHGLCAQRGGFSGADVVLQTCQQPGRGAGGAARCPPAQPRAPSSPQSRWFAPAQLSRLSGACAQLPDPAPKSLYFFFFWGFCFGFGFSLTSLWAAFQTHFVFLLLPRGEKAEGMNSAGAGPRSCPCTCARPGDGWEGTGGGLCFLSLSPTSISASAARAGTCTRAAAGGDLPWAGELRSLKQPQKERKRGVGRAARLWPGVLLGTELCWLPCL